ncbi:MAG: DUF1835 domain-containing protein [Chitinophagales bacterium]|nr:DUF1835 domain-containing protein [Chitinophagales bacterium]
MIHIVFNEGELDLMKQVMELEESLAGEVVLVRDDYAVGPLMALDTEEGWQARFDWWMDKISYSHYQWDDSGRFDDRETVAALTAKMKEDPNEQIWIWMGQNQHDVCGYYWLIPQLSAFQGRVMVLYLNNLPFINEKGHIFYPSWLSEIPAREFLKARKLARPVTLSEFEVDPDEWRKLVEENAVVRILEGGKKIAGKGEDFFDSEIMKNLTKEWQKAWRVVSNTLNRMKVKTGDVIIEWRIKQLIAAGKIEVTGEAGKNWKEFDMRLPGESPEA